MSFLPLTALAHYDETDRFKLIASVDSLYDDNLFRLSDNQSSGELSRSDTIITPQAQAIYSNTFSRQDVSLDAAIYSPRYLQNESMDYTGHSVSGKWLGSVAELWHPQLGYEDSRTLASFDDVALGLKDMINEQTFSGGLAYGGERYAKVLVDGSRKEKDHSSQVWLNLVDQGFGMSGGWISDAGSQATLRYDHRDIHFTRPLQNFLDRDYTQQKWQIRTVWPVTHQTRLSADIGRIAWDFEANGSHSSDYIGGFSAVWATTEKLQLTGTYRRDADDPGANLQVSMSDNYSLQADWAMLTKLAWNLLWSKRNTQYGVAQNSPLPEQNDSTTTYKLGLNWAPYDFLSSGVFWQEQNRDSNAANNDYRDNQYGVNLQLRY